VAEWFGCTDFLIVEGWVQETVIQNATPSGTLKTIIHYNKFGTAIEPSTGHRYIFTESSHFLLTSNEPQSTFTLLTVVNLIGQGNSPDQQLHTVDHITVNAQGEITSIVSNGSFVCRQ
jgi:hypothetical protein